MRTKLHKTLFISALALLGMQEVSAQYVGLPFSGSAIQLGGTPNVANRIELEDFDGTATNADGVNTGHTSTTPPLTGTYNDKSTEPSGTNPYRPNGSVDIAADGTGHVLTGIQGQEYTLYTIQIMEDGNYDFVVNYRINSGVGNKKLQVFLRDAGDLTSEGTLYNGTLDPGTGAYEDLKIVDGTSLTAGTYVLFVRFVSAGPRFDFIDVTRVITLSTDENKLKANAFKVFPNPASDSQFNLNIESKWGVYSLLGTKVLEGEGKKVDLSLFAKGAYILRTPFTSKMLISK